MILGFGNNVVSSLASDITASQTTFSVIPGDGPLFASLLTSDFSNKSTTLKNYAKITLTDSGETAFEVCHLTAVNGDTLTVIRGQEGTAAKGWALKDVVANFATRGSENAFTQIAHIQSGFYTSGTAGGTANALTLELPTTFFLNGSADWVLKTPIVVYPTQNNTGPATLQLTMGGRVLGTFPLYKGNKAALVANDILKDVALVCLMDNTKTFFNVANPGAIYAGLGTAAFANLVTSKTDFTAGRVLTTGWMSLGGYGTDNLLAAADAKKSLRNGFYGVQSEPTYGNASLISFGYDSGSQVHIIAKQGGQAPLLGVCGSTPQGAFGNWGKIYTEFQKPTAGDVGALPITGGTVTGNAVVNGTLGVGNGRKFEIISQNSSTLSGSLLLWGNADRPTVFEFKDGSGYHFYSQRNKDGSISLVVNGGVSLTNWSSFDSRYYTKAQSDAGYMPKTGAYTKAESDGRFQAKGSYTPAGEAYTKAQSDARYIQGVQLGARALSNSANASGGNLYLPAGCVAVGYTSPGSSDANNIKLYYKPIQRNINGAWVTISG